MDVIQLIHKLFNFLFGVHTQQGMIRVAKAFLPATGVNLFLSAMLIDTGVSLTYFNTIDYYRNGLVWKHLGISFANVLNDITTVV